ncbi:MAG: DUF2332 domain-containing protein [Nocardiopsaceae bacterium]|nr:DUF2332 domain-containing protein [Nocardiopsaceae bacterium]
MTAPSLERTTAVAAAFTAVAERRAAGGYAPVYAAMAAACATDPTALDLAARASDGQNPPSLLLGAVQYLLARHHQGHPLARFYPVLTGQPAPDPEADAPWPDLRAFLAEHRDQVAEIVATRLVQTHEVGRCAYLYPALTAARRHADAPLAAVEIGPSAGLTLVPDRYAYDYGTGSTVGAPDSPLVLASELRGPHRPPIHDGGPEIVWRAGIDLNPLDLADAEDRTWLRSLIWPDHPDRASRLDAAFTAARTGALPPIYRGTAAQHLPALLERAPAEAVVCVYHTAVTAHFTPKARTEHADLLRDLSKTRRILWLCAEPGEDPRLRFTDLDGGHSRTEVVLGDYHPHGAWLDWHHPG